MGTKGLYKTKQLAELLAYLQTVQGQHITVGDVRAHFKAQGTAIGEATIYRHLERMVEDGLVHKYIVDSNSPACFEYVGDRPEDARPGCFHCKCEKCGRLIHLHCDALAQIEGHLAAHHGFRLDPMRTVFYGICAQCQAQGQ